MLYTSLLTSGKLNSYLIDIDKWAEEMFFRVVKQMVEREGVTEKLKAENQMKWVGRMNNIRSRAAEIVNTNLIYIFKQWLRVISSSLFLFCRYQYNNSNIIFKLTNIISIILNILC